ncbi:DUF3574 domain-containing protein [Phenylobacterium sp.]|uniref:DUF3574 domain-containing protein n=1 Tax=Phenylobacterium sp. TaxID=1871053 RepID=UPI0035B2603B
MKLGWGTGLIGALALGGCASVPPPPPAPVAVACPQGQESMRMAQLFFGRKEAGDGVVSDTDFQAFVDQEVTPRFPAGLTVLDGGGQWRGPENQLIREASKIVLIVMPGKGDRAKLDEVRQAYKTRFHQDSVLLVTQQTCVSF